MLMRKYLLTLFTVLSVSCLGQDWIRYEIDSAVTVTIPGNFQVTDTLGQRYIVAQVDNGLILIAIIENEGKHAINIEDEEDLTKYYKGFVDGFIKSQKGQLIKDEIVDFNGLKLLRFSFKASLGEEKQLRHCLSVFVNDKNYAINFWELESMTDEMISVRERLFNSIELEASLTMKNQMSYSVEGTRTYRIGYFIGRGLGSILIIAVLALVVAWIIRRGRRRE